MFDTEYVFEELPILFGTTEVAMCTGVALLEGEIGRHDYGFCVIAITLEGNHVDNYRDNRRIHLSAGCDEPFGALLFRRIADRIEADDNAAEVFSLAVREHLAAVA